MNTTLWWLGQNSVAAAVMTPLVLLACRLFRDRPAVQHALWLLILLKFITPPLIAWPWKIDQVPPAMWSAPVAAPNPPRGENVVAPEIADDAMQRTSREIGPIHTGFIPAGAPGEIPLDWLSVPAQIAIAVWLAGALVCLVWQLRRVVLHAGLVRRGMVAPPHLTEEVVTSATLFGIRPPGAVLVQGILSPFIWCLGRIRLAWPATLASAADIARSRGIIAHELAHLRRRDHWIAWLELGAGIVFWWNPLFWFVRRRLRETAEMACDAVAIATNFVGRREYAELLLVLSAGFEYEVPTPFLAGSAGTPASFERRLMMILSDRVSGKLSWRGIVAMIGFALLALPHWSLGQPAPLPEQNREVQSDKPPATEKPNRGAKLQPGVQEKLEWGQPVNGLRMALAWPPTLGEPAAGEVPDFFLAVQNVSEASVRLCTTAEAPNQRRLSFSTDGRLQGRTVSSEPNGVDATLEPREVVFLRLFVESGKDETPKAPHGSMMAAAVRQSPAMTLQADFEIAKAPAGAWSGKLATPETRAGVGAEAPKNRKAQELFKVWLAHARVNGKVPGGCIARLGDRVKEFVRANTGDPSGEPYAKRMAPLVSRLDGARDWQPTEASTLLTDIAAVSDVPLSVVLEEFAGMTIIYGPPLTKELENAPWGKALPNGLRAACLLEPRTAAHRLGTALKMRILVHNAGQEPVVFRARTWHHIEPTAHEAKGAEIEMESMTRYTRPPLVAYRLVSGGYVELASPGIGIGKRGFHAFKAADIGSWMDAKVGDDVTLTPGPLPLGDWNEVSVVNAQPRWWLDFLSSQLNLAAPLPAEAAERAELLRRTVSDIFYADVTAEEIAAFVADREPDALESLAKRLAGRANLKPFSGALQSGTTKIRVTAEDPRAAKPAARPAEKPAAQAAPAKQ